MMRIMGATYGRILNELIRPMIERGLGILARRGMTDPILLRSDAELKYSAPISQMAADEKLSSILSFIATANAGGFGEIINKPALALYIANTMHIPPELLIGE